MKHLLITIVALLMVGCGEEQNPEDSNDTENNASALTPPVVQPVKAPFVEKWDEWEANPEPYGGAEVLAKIKEAKGSGATALQLDYKGMTNLAPLAGLTNLKGLTLYGNKIVDVSPLAGLTKLEELVLGGNKITDVSPLAALTNLRVLLLHANPIPDDQKEMLNKALPNCRIIYL